jgi:hypothetical protein
MADKASREAAMFADQKDDPTASTYALEFLRRHTDVANETVPWHTHSDLTSLAPQQARQGGSPTQ